MANTISSRTYRDKFLSTRLAYALRKRLVAEAVCKVDTSDSLRIQNPYSSTPTVVVQALSGSYTPADFTTTDDTLTVTDEFIVAEHIRDFESLLTQFDLYASRIDQMTYKVKEVVDRYVINNLCEDGTGTYTTPAGGFTAANFNTIMGNLIAALSGYETSYADGLFLIIENTDLPGIITAQATNGFNYADTALRNGFVNNYMGMDIYVVRSGTFADETLGTKTYTNAGHRVAGVKKVATYAAPRLVKIEEKMVSGKTGMEIAVYGYIGFKLWANNLPLVIDITLA
jgi:hypothetical protein